MNNNPEQIIIHTATKDDIFLIRQLALIIWPETYREILPPQQLNYMLELIYSPASLEKQMNEGHNFLLVKNADEIIGFASYNQCEGAGKYKLQKIYIMHAYQGRGIGEIIINYIIYKIKKKGASALQLNVNRQNKARLFYEHFGFKIIGEEDIDIGNGYFMNDYVMEKCLHLKM